MISYVNMTVARVTTEYITFKLSSCKIKAIN